MLLVFLLMGIPLSVAQFSISQQDCGFSQQQVFDCLFEKIDLDKNGGVSREELDHAIGKSNNYLVKAFGFFRGSALIFKQCDYDKNGEITARDTKLAAETCFHNDLVRCGMKKVCK